MNPVADVVVGAESEATVVVTREVTVRHFHEEMPEVYGTPFMIYLMEVAASQAIQPSLPPGWTSVGFEVNIRHLAATPVGRTVTARAKVVAVTGKLVTFEVQAHDGVNLIGTGTHSRAPIDLARFEKGLAGQST
ncbi:MAG: thioesterase family protein [Holophagaceae bacterium]|nr:thioesterase family protein [Holophagaceae bacterium]